MNTLITPAVLAWCLGAGAIQTGDGFPHYVKYSSLSSLLLEDIPTHLLIAILSPPYISPPQKSRINCHHHIYISIALLIRCDFNFPESIRANSLRSHLPSSHSHSPSSPHLTSFLELEPSTTTIAYSHLHAPVIHKREELSAYHV